MIYVQSNLLEHALDSILERGEIPDVQLITELICHSISYRDYGRTLQLLNIMTEASIKMKEVEWFYLLQKNVYQFNTDALEGLIKYLSTSGTINADPALSLVRAMESQCGVTLVKGTYLLTDDTSTQQCGLSLLESEDKYACSSLAEQDQLTCKNLCTDIILDIPDSDREIPQLGVSDVMSRDISLSGQRLEYKLEHSDFGQQGPQVSAIDEVLDSMNSYAVNSYGEMPSASEILELWEQERINGTFAPKTESRTTLIR